MDYSQHFNTRHTPQTVSVPGKDQVENSAGGHVFAVPPLDRAKRFLILGSEGGSYYASEQTLTVENASVIVELAKTQPCELIELIFDVSRNGRAPKNDPALFALAIVVTFAPDNWKRHALNGLHLVARTGYHLQTFVRYLRSLRGIGRAIRRGISGWFNKKAPADLGYQAIKYQSRGGMSMRDLLRLCHARPSSAEHDALFKWIVDGLDPAKADK